jgi:hypothetical protein
MTAEPTRDELRQQFQAMTADDCERLFHAALEAADMRGIEAALLLLAAKDPHRAERLMDLTRVALIVAEAR